MTNKHVLQRGGDWLGALLSCTQAQSGGKKKMDEEKVEVGRLTKLEGKQKERKKQSGGENKQHSRSLGLQHSRNNGLEINGLVIHS